MILPVALVDRWPADEYKTQHTTIESALKHSVSDLLKLRKEVELLKQLEHEWGLSPIPEELLTKEIRGYVKRNGGDSMGQRFLDYIVNRDEQFGRCLKFTDYPAMVMAAYPNSKFIDKNRFRTEIEEIIKDKECPVLLEPLKAGKACMLPCKHLLSQEAFTKIKKTEGHPKCPCCRELCCPGNVKSL
jgi:hypothetical protein